MFWQPFRSAQRGLRLQRSSIVSKITNKNNNSHSFNANVSCSSFSTSSASDAPKRSYSWLFLIPITTFGLGVWQVYRLNWKMDLIAKIEQRLRDPPVDISEIVNLEPVFFSFFEIFFFNVKKNN